MDSVTDQILFWVVVGFLVFFNVVFAVPKGGWKRLWIKINTCQRCGLTKGHTKECQDFYWDPGPEVR